MRKRYFINLAPSEVISRVASSAPVLFGNVKQVEGGSIVETFFSLHPLIKSMMTWMLIFTLVAFAILIATVSVKAGAIFSLLIPIAIIFIGRKIEGVLSKFYSKDLIIFLKDCFMKRG